MDKMDQSARPLWRIVIRTLGLSQSDRAISAWHVAGLGVTTEKQAVALARKRFRADWWEDHIIVNVEPVGYLHGFDEYPLYDDDDLS